MNSRGVAVSVVSSVAFALFSLCAAYVAPLSGVDVWSWRIVMTVPGVLALFALSRRWGSFTGELRQCLTHPRRVWSYVFCAPMLGVQMWLFGWAPQNGHTLDVTLGYFLMPLVMVAIGAVIFREHLSPLARLAAILATLAVLWEVWRTGSMSWVTAVIAIGYPMYFMVRRACGTEGIAAMTWEMILAVPVAFATIAWSPVTPTLPEHPQACVMIVVLGVISVVGTVTYVLAVRMLPYSIFGLLSYLEPVLVTVVALIIGERITGQQWLTYAGMWSAVALLGVDGVVALLRSKRPRVIPVRPWRRPRSRRNS